MHARDYAKQVTEHKDTEIVAVWDEIPERGQAEASQRGVAFIRILLSYWQIRILTASL